MAAFRTYRQVIWDNTRNPLSQIQINSQTGTTHFLYDGNAPAIEFDAGGTAQRFYAHGSDAEADDPLVWFERPTSGGGWARRHLHADPRGSIVAITRSDGVSIAGNSEACPGEGRG